MKPWRVVTMGDWLKTFKENVKKDKKRSLLMLVLTGVLILVIAWPVSKKDNDTSGNGLGSGIGGTGSSQSQGGEAGTESIQSSAVSYSGFSEEQTLEDYVAASEERLRILLSAVEGAGKVEVMITARATREKVVGKDVTETASKISESDSSGGTRVTDESSYGETSLYSGENLSQGSGEPYVIKELVPQIEGVVVAAQGAGDEYIVDEITQAVSVLFNLPVHKIKVVKMES